MNGEWVSDVVLKDSFSKGKISLDKIEWQNINNKELKTLDISLFDLEVDCDIGTIPEYLNIEDNYQSILDNAIDTYINRYNFYNDLCFNRTRISLLRFNKDGFYKNHIDYNNQTFTDYDPKFITIYFCICDEYSGGEFVFDDKIVRLNSNEVLIFDSGPTNPYRINNIIDGNMVVGVCWLF